MRILPEFGGVVRISRSRLRQDFGAKWYPSWCLLIFTVLGVFSLSHHGFAQSNLVLRSLEIPKSEIKRFDKHGVYLNDGTTINWDDILQATLPVGTEGAVGTEAAQKSFDSFLKTRGLPLFRIRHRLSIGDVASLVKLVEPLYETLNGSPSSLAEARFDYLISLGTMRARLHAGDRAAAVQPFLRAREVRGKFAFDSSLPPGAELMVSPKGEALSPLITPIFFDAEAARRELSLLRQQGLGEQQVGKVYGTALAICGDEQELAEKWLSQLAEQDSNWAPIFAAQLELKGEAGERIEDLQYPVWRAGLTRSQSTVVDFILALAAQRIPTDSDRASLLFLKIAAASEGVDRHIASASLYQAFLVAKQIGNVEEAEILKRELLDKYFDTYHGRRVKAEDQQ